MDPVFPLDPVGSPTTSAPSEIETGTPSVSTMTIARDTQLPESVLSVPSRSPVSAPRSVGSVVPPLPQAGPSSPIGPPETLLTTSSLVTESAPALIPSRCTASPRVPTSPSIRESLWAPETDDESPILRASHLVQSIAFPEDPVISFDTSFLRPTASACSSQEQAQLSTVDESSSESPAITSSSSSRSLTPTAIISGSSISVSSTSEALEQQVLAERQRADDERDARMRELEEELVCVREEARIEKEALEQQVLAERQRAEDEQDARMREFEEELAHVREEAHTQKEALEQQVLAERQRVDEELARVWEEVHAEEEALKQQLRAERDEELACMREALDAEKEALEQQLLAERDEELARVRAELDQGWQQCNLDEEMQWWTDSQKNQERDEKQLSKAANLLAHREEFARKKEDMDERWNEKLRWHNKTNNQFQGLFNMVQGVIDSCAEQKESCEQERLAAEQRPCQ